MSHQPPHIRSANQVQDAENAVFSVVDGVSKRPGTQWIANITPLPNAGLNGTFSGSVSVPPPPSPGPGANVPLTTGTGTDGNPGDGGDPGGPTPECQPPAYASTYVFKDFTANVFEPPNNTLIWELASGNGETITLTQQASACIWTGSASYASGVIDQNGETVGAGHTILIGVTITLDLQRTPARWGLGIFVSISDPVAPDTKPVFTFQLSKQGASPQVTGLNLNAAQAGTDDPNASDTKWYQILVAPDLTPTPSGVNIH